MAEKLEKRIRRGGGTVGKKSATLKVKRTGKNQEVRKGRKMKGRKCIYTYRIFSSRS